MSLKGRNWRALSSKKVLWGWPPFHCQVFLCTGNCLPAVEISAPLNIWISRLRWQQTIYFCLLHWRLSVCLHRLPPLQYLCSRCCGLLTQFTEGCGLHKEIREWDGLEMEWVWSGLWREWWPYSFLFKVLIQGAAESFLIPIFDRLYALYISWVRSFPFLICTTWVCGAKINT